MQKCIFDDKKICNNCSDCNICDLDQSKTCDNCGKCISVDSEYFEIKVEGILENESEFDDYIYEEDLAFDEKSNNNSSEYEDSCDEVEELFIEDFPELRDKYYKNLEKIFFKK
ncbi:hypothetical protein ABG79_01209 [Caloramator mitchellensis]|uniref:Uncharacterized protein n=1 Tax=Caloramator mitchellensis TaxID=908809 RepID=A0A0R3JU11_CALMK|nr:hypothetical protein [Caloramator mitchellensis]KRQ87019.1 hypothetical protein ABG79_01209 [Caloramator mitchellensis]